MLFLNMEVIYFLIGVSVVAFVFLVYGLYLNWRDAKHSNI